MKTRRYLFVFLLLLMAYPILAQKRIHIRVLYVGGATGYEGNRKVDEATRMQQVQQRTASWKQMLEQYFTEVTAVNASEWTEEMSSRYDVTVMDGLPRPITPGVQDIAKQIYLRPGYISEDFSCPMITIGEMSSRLGTRIGSKNDWYCLCLENYAHSWKKDHPIFNGPFKVKMKVEQRATPSHAFHFQYEDDEKLPETMPMWQAQTRGYKDTPDYSPGLVSRHWGYEDSPETEIISGGVSSKSIHAVAIGRHGNYFHWGFSASPMDMTEQAKQVFANAVVYISKFKGQGIIARKYNEAIATRADVKAAIYMASDEGYQEIIKMNDEAMEEMQRQAEVAKQKKAKGETLTETEQYLLNFKPAPPPSHETFVKQYAGDYFDQFGMDFAAYKKFFTENMDYLYGGDGRLHLVLDEDVKSLGIPNNDIRLLDTAISMLEQGKDIGKARRILSRYTQKDFSTAKAWRQWFVENKDKLFFTESGGWVWLVNSREPGANDYAGWLARKKVRHIETGTVTAQNPVAVSAEREYADNNDQYVYVKFTIYRGFHIYGHVSSEDPFIPTKVNIVLPKGVSAVEPLELPAARVLSKNGTTIYEDTAVFRQKISGKVGGDITCEVEYQCCDDNVCLPPATITVKAK
ncbi:MAG: hypothetical protein IK124_01235 [Prevotella sp.]|nr:hypothetical protein [Prevotella sp.]